MKHKHKTLRQALTALAVFAALVLVTPMAARVIGSCSGGYGDSALKGEHNCAAKYEYQMVFPGIDTVIDWGIGAGVMFVGGTSYPGPVLFDDASLQNSANLFVLLVLAGVSVATFSRKLRSRHVLLAAGLVAILGTVYEFWRLH